MAHIHISSDRLQAFLEWEEVLDLEQIQSEMRVQGVKFGVDPSAIRIALGELLASGSVCVATGEPPIPAQAASVRLAVDQVRASGELDEDSQCMDFRERGGIHSVLKGDPIGTWIPATDGTPGKGVDGESIDAPAASGSDQSRGQNVRAELGANGCLNLFAEIDGVVRLGPNGDVYVTNLFELEADVDLGCGNIKVAGSVHIHGTIRSGFKVIAGQDIDVDAAIEDAQVEAGQYINVGTGILAGEDSLIQAEKGIKAKYAQNATLRSGGDVILEVDTNSSIEAAGSIIAKEGAGHLRGGRYVAQESIVAKELGSSQGAVTHVRVGVDPKLLRERGRIQRDLQAAQGHAKKLQRQRGVQNSKRVGQSMTRDQASGIRRAMKAQRDLKKTIELLQSQQRGLESAMAKAELPTIRIEKTIYSGVRIQMGDAHLLIENTRPGGTFRRDPDTGEITFN